MTKKNNNLINEGVVRRWGKLANLNTLTESFLDTVTEAEHEEEEMGEEEMEIPADLEVDAAEAEEAAEDAEDAMDDMGDMEMAEEPSLDLDEDQVEQIAQVFFDTLSQVTDGDVEFEVTSSDEPAEGDMDDDAAMMDDPAMAHGDEDPAMMDDPAMAHDPAMYEESQDQDLQEINVVDDEELTEAVLARVVERLLKNK